MKYLIILMLILFSACSVKVLTFGTEEIKEHQDYIIGAKTHKGE